jgi:hypothetical protein
LPSTDDTKFTSITEEFPDSEYGVAKGSTKVSRGSAGKVTTALIRFGRANVLDSRT